MAHYHDITPEEIAERGVKGLYADMFPDTPPDELDRLFPDKEEVPDDADPDDAAPTR